MAPNVMLLVLDKGMNPGRLRRRPQNLGLGMD